MKNNTTATINATAPKLHMSRGNSKTGRVWAFSTLPGSSRLATKDGRILTSEPGTCAGVCEACENHGCYAISSAKRYPSARKAWEENTILVRYYPRSFRKQLTRFLLDEKPDVVRVHVSGEFDEGLAGEAEFNIWVEAARTFSDVTFYLYTKRFDLITNWEHPKQGYDREFPSNFIVNRSLVDELPPDDGGKYFIWSNGVVPELDVYPKCPAVDAPEPGKRAGRTNHRITCDRCGMCMNARIPVVVVSFHR